MLVKKKWQQRISKSVSSYRSARGKCCSKGVTKGFVTDVLSRYLENGDVFVDIGCAGGELIAHVAENFGVPVLGVEMQPELASAAEKMIKGKGKILRGGVEDLWELILLAMRKFKRPVIWTANVLFDMEANEALKSILKSIAKSGKQFVFISMTPMINFAKCEPTSEKMTFTEYGLYERHLSWGCRGQKVEYTAIAYERRK